MAPGKAIKIASGSLVIFSLAGIILGLFQLALIERTLKTDVASSASLLKNQFVQNQDPSAEIDFGTLWHSRRSGELTLPESLVPDKNLFQNRALVLLFQAGQTCSPKLESGDAQWKSDSGLVKLWTWYLSVCEKKPMNQGFFESKPYIHPMGGRAEI